MRTGDDWSGDLVGAASSGKSESRVKRERPGWTGTGGVSFSWNDS